MKKIHELDFTKKKVIAFDLDGTLIDSTMFWRKVEQKIIEQHSGNTVPLKELSDGFMLFMDQNHRGNNYEAYWQTLCSTHKLDLTLTEYINVQDETARLQMADIRYKEKVPEVLSLLKQQGYKMTLATASSKKDVEFYMQNQNISSKAHFHNFFEPIITKNHIINSKPHPEIYHKVLDTHGIEASECIVFEDSLRGIRAAKAAGIEVVHVHDEVSIPNISEIENVADYHLDNFGELLDFLT